MTDHWYLEPRNTLILRDGRPTTGSTVMTSLSFPWPSSIAGMVRTNCGRDENGDFKISPEEAKQIAVAGPWLCKIENDNQFKHYFPAPMDFVWMSPEEKDKKEIKAIRYRLSPNDEPILGNMPDGLKVIWPVREDGLPEGKPAKGMPAFWSLDTYKNWLLLKNCQDTDQLGEKFTPKQVKELGLGSLTKEERMHVAIDSEKHSAIDGQLFSTENVRFTAVEKNDDTNHIEYTRLALAFDCHDQRLKNGPAVLGGKGTLSFLGRQTQNNDLEALKKEVVEAIDSPRLRVILITPALFEAGYLPKDKTIDGAKVIAVRCERSQFISGFDMATKRPKVARRMVPAGSVYWVEFDTVAQAKEWAQKHFFTCVSDDEQDCRDGFGLCLIGRGN